MNVPVVVAGILLVVINFFWQLRAIGQTEMNGRVNEFRFRCRSGLFPLSDMLVAKFRSASRQSGHFYQKREAPLGRVSVPLHLSSQQTARLETQLISLLDLLRGSTDSGMTIPDALRLACHQSDEDGELGSFLRDLHVRKASGFSLGEALHLTGMQSTALIARLCLDLQLVLKAGSQASEVLGRLRLQAANSVERRRKLRSATAQMRLQGRIVAFAPAFVALPLALLRPQHFLFFVHSMDGMLAGIFALIFWFSGFLWLQKLMATGEAA